MWGENEIGLGQENLERKKSKLNYFLIKKADVECYEKLDIDKDKISAPCKINQ